MPNFRYRALTESGDVVGGLIAANTVDEVARRIDFLRLVPIERIVEEKAERVSRFSFKFESRGRPEDVTMFTLDLALLLKAGAGLDRALDLLATDVDIGRLSSAVRTIRSEVLSGESFADALANHPALFPSVYVALIRVGEASGTLEKILELLARDRSRSEALRRKLVDALRYPTFLFFAAGAVLVFFLMFVLPQFSIVLRDFGAAIDPVAASFMWVSDQMTAHKDAIGFVTVIALAIGFILFRQERFRTSALSQIERLPVARSLMTLQRTALFCRNLEVLLTAGVPLTVTLRILADMMSGESQSKVWNRVVEQVRQGGKLSEALEESRSIAAMAIRMLRLGEETGQLPQVAGRVAEFYETKLQRSLDRVVGLVGPLAIVTISTIVGGLIISVMTALLSVTQSVG